MSKFKIGDRVMVNGEEDDKIFKDEAGTIIKISSRFISVEFDKNIGGHSSCGSGRKGHCWAVGKNMVKRLGNNQTIIVHTKGSETIATLKQGKEVLKSAKAKCSPEDEFNFEIGAKLAFERLVGEDKPTYREVKRKAEVGEWIKIVNTLRKNVYSDGEIFKVKHLQACHGSNVGVGIGKMFVAMESEYVVLENYQPPIKDKTLADFTNLEIIEELFRRCKEE